MIENIITGGITTVIVVYLIAFIILIIWIRALIATINIEGKQEQILKQIKYQNTLISESIKQQKEIIETIKNKEKNNFGA